MSQSAEAESHGPELPKSLRRLLVESYLTFVVAVAVGSVLGGGLSLWMDVRGYCETHYLIADGPPDDFAITRWGSSQPHVLSFETERRGDELWVRSEYRGLNQQPDSLAVVQELRSLGYDFRGMRGGRIGVLTTLAELFASPVFLATSFGSLQLVFAMAGWWGMRALRNHSLSQHSVFVGNLKAIGAGLLCGVLLLAVGAAYEQILRGILGKSPPSFWDNTQGLPVAALYVLIVFGAIGAPVSEEIFFRGYLFGKFQSAGRCRMGIIVSSLLFGVAHFSDPWHIPGIIVFGCILAGVYRRTGTLVAPITAHAVNNLTGLLLLASSG